MIRLNPRLFRGKARSVARTLTLSKWMQAQLRAIGRFNLLVNRQNSTYAQRPAQFWMLRSGRYRRDSSDYSLAQAFGAGAIQDDQWLIIQKADLGLKDADDSTARLMAALIARWATLFEADRRIRVSLWRYQHLIGYERQLFTVQLLVPSNGAIVSFSPQNFLM
jgi:hypothetical protein